LLSENNSLISSLLRVVHVKAFGLNERESCINNLTHSNNLYWSVVKLLRSFAMPSGRRVKLLLWNTDVYIA